MNTPDKRCKNLNLKIRRRIKAIRSRDRRIRWQDLSCETGLERGRSQINGVIRAQPLGLSRCMMGVETAGEIVGKSVGFQSNSA